MSGKPYPREDAVPMAADAGTHVPYPGSRLGGPGVLAEILLLEAVGEAEGEGQGPAPAQDSPHLGASHLRSPNFTQAWG